MYARPIEMPKWLKAAETIQNEKEYKLRITKTQNIEI